MKGRTPAAQTAPLKELKVEDIRRLLSKAEDQKFKDQIDDAERTLENLKVLLVHVPTLHNGKLSTGTIDYAAFRIETLSLIFEIAQQTFRKFSSDPIFAYDHFLNDLGDEVGLTFGRDLMNRLIQNNVLLQFQDMPNLLDLWASFENDTGAGETKITQYSQEEIIIRLRNNPLRRAETTRHAHCGFYKSYIVSLINEIFTVRARFLRKRLEGATIQARSVVGIKEQPDADDQCVFTVTCRSEKLVDSFDLLTEAHNQFYKLGNDDDYSQCMIKARSALVKAQMEAIGIKQNRQPRRLYTVYKDILPKKFKLMDDTYQRASSAVHPESKPSKKMDRNEAWILLRDIRRCVYALELLDMNESEQASLQNKVLKFERLEMLEQVAEKIEGLDLRDKQELKELIARMKKGIELSEEGQQTLITVLQKLKDKRDKAWEVLRPVLSELLTAAAKKQLGLE